MTAITAAMVKDLRERTGAGMMECKNALVEAQGNMEAAEDIIAKSGHRKAAKSAGRIAAQGRICVASSPKAAACLEINCETDFVARDESFIQFCDQVSQLALKSEITDVDKLLETSLDGSQTVEQSRQALIARIGENIQIRRIGAMKAGANERIGSYIHHARIGVLILLEGGNDDMAKEMSMHTAAMRPQFINPSEVPKPVVEKEKEIFMERAKESGKPAEVLEKIVNGQLQKYLNEICLEGQPFFKDPDQSVGTVLKTGNAKVKQMIRFEVGEGIEVIKKSFEDEVKAVRGGN